jgi:preprotein translocase subunit YajC
VINWIMGLGGPQGEGGGSPYGMLIMLVLMFAVIYFLLIRPQQKRQRAQQDMLSKLVKGDRVVTSAGMIGTIVGIGEKENIIVLKFGENTKIEFLKSSIVGRADDTEKK